MENILGGHPLLNLTGPSQPQANIKVQRKWVVKELYKCPCDQKRDKGFVNNALPSEFHRKVHGEIYQVLCAELKSEMFFVNERDTDSTKCHLG